VLMGAQRTHGPCINKIAARRRAGLCAKCGAIRAIVSLEDATVAYIIGVQV